MTWPIHDALPSDVNALAQLWFDGWHDAHAAIVPETLTKLRTRDSFLQRTENHLPTTRVLGSVGEPMGFYMYDGDELYQFYIAEAVRGTQAATTLMADCEAKFTEHGISKAWLACSIGNNRAARFYAKCGWVNVGSEMLNVETSAGDFPIDIWRFEKHINSGVSGRTA